jgi:anti-sigma regulatory factor (Ser/Thr protein kinase)
MAAPDQHLGVADAAITGWDGASADSLAHALRPPATDCIEADVLRLAPRTTSVQTRSRHTGSRRRLTLTLTTRSVYRHQVARIFVDALQARLDVPVDLHERVHTALQEAVMNAMLHGNLGLGSGLRDDLRALAASHAAIEARLASEQIARSMIRVEATWTRTILNLVVRDSGFGFSKTELPSEDERLAAGRVGSGRGLMILETLCDRVQLLRSGTTIELGFFLPTHHP